MKEQIKISMILPSFNEELAVRGVIRDIRRAMAVSVTPYEIIVVDDCSEDATASIAAEEGAIVLRHDKRKGSGACRRSGMLAAQGEIIVMLDADGSYDPQDIPKLLEWFPEYDQVNGARSNEHGSLKSLRLLVKWLISRLASILFRRDIPDLNTGLKVFKKNRMEPFLDQLPDGFSCVTTMTLAFLRCGLAVKFIPVTYRKRIGKSKFRPFRDTLNYLVTIIRIFRSSI